MCFRVSFQPNIDARWVEECLLGWLALNVISLSVVQISRELFKSKNKVCLKGLVQTRRVIRNIHA